MKITKRPAVAEDFDFLFQLHKATMREQVEVVFGDWDDEWQLSYFRKHFDPTVLQVIQLNGKDVGVLFVQVRTEELFIARIEILPLFQRQGIGTAVIRQQIEAARSQGKLLALQVFKSNITARNLYQRLGFGVTGENETHYIMACC